VRRPGIIDQYRRAADYVDRIFKGETPPAVSADVCMSVDESGADLNVAPR
jgi:hypothetical protein